MAGYTRDLKRILRKAGCYFYEQEKGDHEKWYSPTSDTYFTVDGNLKSRHTANAALVQAGLPKAF